jgi:hypothetical protein
MKESEWKQPIWTIPKLEHVVYHGHFEIWMLPMLDPTRDAIMSTALVAW